MMYSSAQCTKGSACSEVACRMDCASARRLVAAITSSTSAPMSLHRVWWQPINHAAGQALRR